MASEKKQSENVPMNKLNEIANENYKTNTENMINHSNEYTRNLINWMNIQNKVLAKNTELLKEYVKSYNSAIREMAEYHSSIIKNK